MPCIGSWFCNQSLPSMLLFVICLRYSFEICWLTVVDLKRLEVQARDGPSDPYAVAKWRILNRLHDRNETMYYKVSFCLFSFVCMNLQKSVLIFFTSVDLASAVIDSLYPLVTLLFITYNMWAMSLNSIWCHLLSLHCNPWRMFYNDLELSNAGNFPMITDIYDTFNIYYSLYPMHICTRPMFIYVQFLFWLQWKYRC